MDIEKTYTITLLLTQNKAYIRKIKSSREFRQQTN